MFLAHILLKILPGSDMKPLFFEAFKTISEIIRYKAKFVPNFSKVSEKRKDLHKRIVLAEACKPVSCQEFGSDSTQKFMDVII